MLGEFIDQNFLTPLCHYYTPIGTATYGLALAAVIFLTYKILTRLKVKIDKRFFIGLIPFIIYGGWTRSLRDYSLGIYQSKLFCAPPIYFFIFAVTLTTIIVGVLIERKTKGKIGYEKVMLAVGAAMLLYDLTLTNITNPTALGIVLGITAAWTLIFLGISKIRPKLLSLQNSLILSSHMLDASATFTALTFYGFYEQHVVPSFLIGIAGPWIMFPLKLAVVWTVLWLIDRSKEEPHLKNLLKIVILTLGLALGIRDVLTISML